MLIRKEVLRIYFLFNNNVFKQYMMEKILLVKIEQDLVKHLLIVYLLWKD